MRIKLNKIPADKEELDTLLQDIYLTAKKNCEKKIQSNFTGILEIIASKPNIVDSIQRIREKRGICSAFSGTGGGSFEGQEIDEHFRKSHDEVIQIVREKLYNYHPGKLHGVWVPETGRTENRADAGETVIDQIIQECVRNIIEPVAEAQFMEHSYGCRPMRSAEMALAQISHMSAGGRCCWALKGEITGLFDRMDHNVMISSLWNLGIRDKRVLSIVKQMLKAGILKRRKHCVPKGFQRDISTLLANIYLTRFDDYFKTCGYVRYADQWVILTDSQDEAARLRLRAVNYLRDALNLELSEENLSILDIRRQPLEIRKLEIRMGKKDGQWVCRISPEKEELQRRIRELAREIFRAGKTFENDTEELIWNIVRANFMLVDFMNDYSVCDQMGAVVRSYVLMLRYTAYRTLKSHGGHWIRAGETSNLIGLHYTRRTHIPAVWYKGMYIGITDLSFIRQKNPECKDQRENPYTTEGRRLYDKRTRKRGLRALTDEVNYSPYALAAGMSGNPLYNMEYFMNRSFAYKRDRARCRICGGYVRPDEARILHVDRELSSDRVNRKDNLMTVHRSCRKLIHSNPGWADRIAD